MKKSKIRRSDATAGVPVYRPGWNLVPGPGYAARVSSPSPRGIRSTSACPEGAATETRLIVIRTRSRPDLLVEEPTEGADDVAGDYVSIEAARDLYGVVIVDGEVDEAATFSLRRTQG